MTKHIVGLIIFSFIVGISAFVAGLFAASSGVPSVSPVYVFDKYASEKKRKKKRRCRPHRSLHYRDWDNTLQSVTLKSADYDVATSEFSTVAAFGKDVPEEFNLDLYFYVSDNNGTRFITTETLEASSWTRNYEDSFGWLSRFQQPENLYVIAHVRTLDDDYSDPPVFDIDKATPVTITTANSSRNFTIR